MAQKGTSADNRNQILKSFERLLDERKAMSSLIATKEEAAERQKDKETVDTASTYTVESIVKGLADLQLSFGNTIDGLSQSLSTESSKLGQLLRAIEVEKRHSVELQNVRVAADALDILIQENTERVRAFEADTAEKYAALDADIASRRTAWQKEQEEFEAADRAFFESLRKDREQAEGDYRYDQERQRTVEADEYAERKRRMERELEELDRVKEKAWVERERVIAERQAIFDEYQAKVDAMPAELEAASNKAREASIRETNEAERFRADLLEKEVEANVRVNEMRIQSLETTIAQQAAQIESMTAQLQAVLKQAQDLAMKAVEGTSKSQGRHVAAVGA
jgi:hypothetical protein